MKPRLREIAEKLMEDLCNCDSESCCKACKRDNITLVTEALEVAEREGYARGVEDSLKRYELGFERNDVVQDIIDDIRALAEKDVKP